MAGQRQIIAMGGGALPAELDNLLLVRYFLAQTRRRRPKVAFIGAAHGDTDAGRLRFYAGFSQFECRPTHLPLFARTPRDLESFVLEQDAIFVGGNGGEVARLLEASYAALRPCGRLVSNVGTLEMLQATYAVLKRAANGVDVLLVNLSRGIEQLESLRFEAVNPTFLLRVRKG